ncbi:MAG: ATP-binding cassette domain-containing protein, partial [Acidimicrobiales bacterium]
CYPASPEKGVVRNVNLGFRTGELVALVGENGSGKTTLARLLSLLYEPTTGSILVNGEALFPGQSVSMRRRISIVSQEYLRLVLTATENISMQFESPADTQRVISAARFGGIHNEIEELSEGYETLLGVEFSGGQELSGGQWQRLATARAWYRDADVVILDEPTSALDPEAEVELVDKIRELAQDKLVILISHRFGTVSRADRIVVLQEGEVVEQGSHRELMGQAGLYAFMYSLQAETYR